MIVPGQRSTVSQRAEGDGTQPGRSHLLATSHSRPPVFLDRYGRRLDYLRLSVTDRCDLACGYCRPAGAAAPRESPPLSRRDLVAIARAAAALGMTSIRITGGEPLLRDDIVGLVADIAALPGIDEVSMTTNGTRLAAAARDLATAGLARVNVSLDSLDACRLARLGGARPDDILRGIEAALGAGLHPVKVNVVVSADEAPDDADLAGLAGLAMAEPVHVRYIEEVPLDGRASTAGSLEAIIRGALPTLGPTLDGAGPIGRGPARYFALPGARGTVGLIASRSAPFCETCNRLRVTAAGRLRPCLFCDREIDLAEALATGDPEALIAAFREAARIKPAGHDLAADGGAAVEDMSAIGG
jgi:cyclic pyranopterin phosphate synthase